MNLSFIGNIGKAPELKFAANGNTYCFFSVAMNTHKKTDSKNRVIWWNCAAFSEVAEMIAVNFRKGQKISIVESSIIMVPDKRDNSEKMQIKVWKAEKPDYDNQYKPSEMPAESAVPSDEVPF